MSKSTVLHFRNTFLRPTETFIARIVHNHQRYRPVAVGIRGDDYLSGIHAEMYPGSRIGLAKAAMDFTLGKSPKFMNDVVRRHEPRVVHGHFGQDGYIMVPTCRQYQLPLVVSFYGKDVTQLPLQKIWKRRYTSLIGGTTMAVALSDKMGAQLVELGFDSARVRVVRSGLDMRKYARGKRDTATQRLMLIGRFVEKKGIEYAIKAVAQLTQTHPQISLDIYGGGPLDPEIRALVASLGLESVVNVHGFVESQDVGQLMQAHDILLVPSVTAGNNDQEGLPTVIIEAMASGLAVIASDHAAIPEIVLDGETGLLTKERDPSSIASAVRRLVGDPALRHSLTERAAAFVRDRHEISNTVRELEAIYDEAAEMLSAE